MNEQFETAPNNSDFWDVLNNGVDFISGTLDKYLDLKTKEATTKVLTTPNGLEFFSTGIGLITLMIFVAVIVYFMYK
jgi:hypothetical protein